MAVPNRFRRRHAGRRRPANKKTVLSKGLLLSNNMIYPFRQTISNSAVVSNTTVITQANLSFKLSDLNQYATFTSLFDSYRISKVQLKYIPRTNVDIGVNGNTYSTTVFYAIDYDDIGALGSIAALQEFGNCKSISSHKTITITIKPKVSRTIYQAGVASAYEEPKSNVWIDAAYPNVEHYGFRLMFPPVGGAAGAVTYDVIKTFWVEFKHVK